MDLEELLPDLLRVAGDATMPPVSARAVIARARRRRTRGRLTAATIVLILAGATGLLANQPAPRHAPGVSAALPPVQSVAPGQNVPAGNGLRVSLSGGGACILAPAGANKASTCASFGRPGQTPSPFPETVGEPVNPDDETTLLVGTYVGPVPVRIVLSTGGSSTGATLVISPLLHGKLGYYAIVHYPLLGHPLVDFSPYVTAFMPTGPLLVETAYDAAGHVLATLSWA